MKYRLLLLLAVATLSLQADNQDCENIYHDQSTYQEPFDWLIVGAGPAGILTIGVLMDVGVDPKKIAWIDPEFEVGRMGKYYSHVESNNKAKEFVAFINACATFKELSCPAIDELRKINPQHPCVLESIVEPLRCISAYLRTKAASVQDIMTGLFYCKDLWHVMTHDHGSVSSRHVVLATGSVPRTLNLNAHHNVIPLDYALDPVTLESLVTQDDVIGVIGGAHSAILLLKYLSTMRVKHVYNFYRHPITYAIDQGCWAIDQFGVKGTTGEWAQKVLEKNPPAHITRIECPEAAHLPMFLEKYPCTKLIYAIGFEATTLPAINGIKPIDYYNAQTGVIAPGLFGIGIAFPEYKADDGHPRLIVGLNCFMDYAQRLIPQWIKDNIRGYTRAQEQKELLTKVADLLTISVL